MKLLLVDGSNLIMRAAFGGEIRPAEASPVAAGMIRRAARQVEATHMVVAIDSPQPSWRKELFPEYKAQRTIETMEWILGGYQHFVKLGWWVEERGGYEADDIIATLARRALKSGKRESEKGETSNIEHSTPNIEVVVLSGDSDLMPLTAEGVLILKPENGGVFKPMTAVEVCAKYGIPRPEFLTDFKAMVGDKSDNVPGVPGIGPVRASGLLTTYGNLGMVILAGAGEKCRHSKLVHEHRGAAELAFKLLSLSYDVPIEPVSPKGCLVMRET